MDPVVNHYGKIVFGGMPAEKEPAVAVGVFGKHPSKPDHIPGIGLDTAPLVAFKQTVYDGAFQSHISTWAIWQQLEKQRLAIPWGHIYLQRIGGDILLARLWPSRDAGGRSEYPMALCAHGKGVSIEWMLGVVLPRLADAEILLKNAEEFSELSDIVTVTGRDLQAQAIAAHHADNGRWIASGFDSVTAYPELAGYNLMRLGGALCEWADPESRSRVGGPMAGWKCMEFRVPRHGSDTAASLRDWMGFASSIIGETTPLRLICPQNANWIDMIVGDTDERAFGCFRASDGAIQPLAAGRLELDHDHQEFAVAALDSIDQTLGLLRTGMIPMVAKRWRAVQPSTAALSVGVPHDVESHTDTSPTFADVAGQEQWDLVGAGDDKVPEARHEPSAWVILVVAALAVFAVGFGVWRQVYVPEQLAPAADPNVHWTDNANNTLAVLRTYQRDLDDLKKKAGEDLHNADWSGINRFSDQIEETGRRIADVERCGRWSPQTSANLIHARHVADEQFTVVNQSKLSTQKALLSALSSHGNGPTTAPAEKWWAQYINAKQNELDAKVSLDQPLNDASRAALKQVFSQLSPDHEKLRTIANESWQTQEPSWNLLSSGTGEWKEEFDGIKGAAKNWWSKQREIAEGKFHLTLVSVDLDSLERARGHFAEAGIDAKKSVEQWLAYWAAIGKIVNDPCTVDIISALNSNAKPKGPDELEKACANAAVYLNPLVNDIAKLNSFGPEAFKDNVKSPANSAIQQRSQATRILAAWQRVKIESWPVAPLNVFKGDLEAFAAVEMAMKKLSCTDELSTARSNRWHALVRVLPEQAFDPAILSQCKIDIAKEKSGPDVDIEVRYNLATKSFDTALGASGGNPPKPADLEDFKAIAQEVRKKFPANSANVQDWLDGLAKKNKPPAQVKSSIGLEEAGWTLSKRSDTLYSFSLSTGLRVNFVRVGPDSKNPTLKPFFLCTTEMSVKALKSAAERDPSIATDLWKINPKNVRNSPCAWRASKNGDTVTVEAVSEIDDAAKSWLSLDLPLTTAPRSANTRAPDWRVVGDHPEMPSADSPATHLTPELAKKICDALKCRLPTVGEWTCAYRQFAADDYVEWKKTGDREKAPNLRDALWNRYKQTFEQFLGRRPDLFFESFFQELGNKSPGKSGGWVASPAEKKEDKYVWFGPNKTAGPDDPKFYDMVGNAAEFVVDDADPKVFKVIGLSALSHYMDTFNGKLLDPETAYALPGDKLHFSDVGLRLVLTAPAIVQQAAPQPLDPAPYFVAKPLK